MNIKRRNKPILVGILHPDSDMGRNILVAESMIGQPYNTTAFSKVQHLSRIDSLCLTSIVIQIERSISV